MGKEKTIEERITFLTNLELDAPDLGDIPTIPHRLENASAGVDAGSLVTFSGGVTEQNQADVKNSCLLAANKEYDREKQTEQWYRFYAEVLENVGWVIQEFQFSRITSKKGDFEASAIMFEILRAFCTEDEKVQTAIDVIKEKSRRRKALGRGNANPEISRYAKGQIFR